eukprot:TRINITY_DN10448_c0_g1_i1.p1 TRINITY_DN10448_c0_g1~~TRINITY_DN10448_c0_g1_i1.p1  ORF type:complete len:328 (-),score=35.50 TRINITY_DN10448_c0_g1_i1:50-1012(-)
MYASMLGGSLIGASAATKMAVTGRILGISGTLGGTVRLQKGLYWRAAFLAGLLSGGLLLRLYAPNAFYPLPDGFPLWRSILGGLLVGYGTSLGSGCTSGHGICGLSRLSVRSLANVLTFMFAGAATATALGTGSATSNPRAPALLADLGVSSIPSPVLPSAVGGLLAAFGGALISRGHLGEILAEWSSGISFALALGISGMISPNKVGRFLDLSQLKQWDPSLMFVMGGALCVALPLFQYILRRRKSTKPLLGSWDLPTSNSIDSNLLLGGALFGIGWGIAGMCPGPAIVALAQPFSQTPVILFNVAMCAGMLIFKYVKP